MKALMLFFLVGFMSFHLSALDAGKKKDEEEAQNIKKLFFDTLDPAAVLKDLPPQFVELKDIPTPKDDFETVGDFFVPKTYDYILPGFLFPSKPDSFASVVGGFEGQEMLGPNAKVLVEIEGDLKKNKRYSVLHLLNTTQSGSKKWYHYLYAGNVRVRDFEGKNRAVVIPEEPTIVRTGDILVPFIDGRRTLDLTKGIRKTFDDKARILTLNDLDRKTAGEGSFVFLDKGSDNGLVENQVLEVYLDGELHALKGVDSQSAGAIQIIHLTPTSSAAYVIESRQEFTTGDYASSK